MEDLWKNFQSGSLSGGTSLLAGAVVFVATLLVGLLAVRPLADLVSRYAPPKSRTGRVGRIRFFLVVAAVASGMFVFLHGSMPASARGGQTSIQLTKLILILAAFYPVFEVLLTFFFEFLPELRGRPPVTAFARDIVRTVVLVVVTVYALKASFPTADLGAVLTTSAILSVVIGLALQESLSNVFAGVLLSVDKPFQPGEWIEVEGKEGKVLDSNWRSTRLWTRSDDIIYIPNSTIAKAVLTNHSRPAGRHWCMREVGVEYGAPPNKVRTVLINMMKGIEGILTDPAPEVRVIDYADSAVTYRLLFCIEEMDKRSAIEAEVMRGIWYHLKRNGISIPFPIRDVFVHRAKPEEKGREVLDLLKKVDILSPLEPKELEMLADDLTSQLFARDEVIFRQGDPGSTFYLIKSGGISVGLRGLDGVEAEVARLRPGQYFGEMSLLTGEPRSSTCKALEDSELLCLDRDSFSVLLRENPPIAQAMSEILSSRQQEAREKLEAERETLVRHRPKAEEGQTKRILEKIWTIFGFKR